MYQPDGTEHNSNERIGDDDDDDDVPQQMQICAPVLLSQSTKEGRPKEHTHSLATSTIHPLIRGAPVAVDVAEPSFPNESIGPYDVICGRSKLAFNNIGNRRFRVTIGLFIQRYLAATTKHQISAVIKYATNTFRETGGRFLKLSPDGTQWIALNSKQVHDKIGHALRDGTLNAKGMSFQQQRYPSNAIMNKPDGDTIQRGEGNLPIIPASLNLNIPNHDDGNHDCGNHNDGNHNDNDDDDDKKPSARSQQLQSAPPQYCPVKEPAVAESSIVADPSSIHRSHVVIVVGAQPPLLLSPNVGEEERHYDDNETFDHSSLPVGDAHNGAIADWLLSDDEL